MNETSRMTDSEWTTSTDPARLLEFLWKEGIGSARRWQLLAAACCRIDPDLISCPLGPHIIDVAERSADGLGSAEEISEARATAIGDANQFSNDDARYWRLVALLEQCSDL